MAVGTVVDYRETEVPTEVRPCMRDLFAARKMAEVIDEHLAYERYVARKHCHELVPRLFCEKQAVDLASDLRAVERRYAE